MLISHNRRKTISLLIVFFMALFVRLLPVFSTGLPYNYDSWVYIQQVKYALQHKFAGNIFDYFKINADTIFSYTLNNITIISYVAPLICSFIIFPVYFLTKNLSDDHSASVFASLLAAVSGIFANQTNHLSSESISLLMIAFIAFFSYGTMIKRDSTHLALLLILSTLLSFVNDLTSLLVLCAFGIMFLTIVLSKLKLTIHTYLPFTILIFIQFFRIILDPARTKLTFTLLGGALATLLFFVIIISLFRWHAKSEFVLRRIIIWSVSLTIIIAFLIGVYAAKLAPSNQMNNVLVSLSFHLIPYSIILLFPGLIGSYTRLSKTRDVLNRLFIIIWCVTPLIIGFLMFVPNTPLLDFNLINYLLLGAFPMIGIGLSTLLSSGENKWKPVKGFVTSYFLLALTIMSFPLAIQMFNHNQFYYLPEMNAAKWASIHVLTPTIIDSDYRMGVLLQCFIEDSQIKLGDKSSWLGEVSESEVIYPLEGIVEYVVITDSMSTHGLVRQGFWLPIPLQQDIIEYLDNSPKVNRIFCNGEVTIYKVNE